MTRSSTRSLRVALTLGVQPTGGVRRYGLELGAYLLNDPEVELIADRQSSEHRCTRRAGGSGAPAGGGRPHRSRRARGALDQARARSTTRRRRRRPPLHQADGAGPLGGAGRADGPRPAPVRSPRRLRGREVEAAPAAVPSLDPGLGPLHHPVPGRGRGPGRPVRPGAGPHHDHPARVLLPGRRRRGRVRTVCRTRSPSSSATSRRGRTWPSSPGSGQRCTRRPVCSSSPPDRRAGGRGRRWPRSRHWRPPGSDGGSGGSPTASCAGCTSTLESWPCRRSRRATGWPWWRRHRSAVRSWPRRCRR